MNAYVPEISPFAGDDFAAVWDGWKGRRTATLTAGSLTLAYVKRCRAGLCARAAGPFGIPLLVDDRAPDRSAWVQAFFALPCTLRSNLSLYRQPEHTYAGVRWSRQERLAVRLDDLWERRVRHPVRRRTRRAREAGWCIDDLTAEQVASADAAIRDTERRHGTRGLLSAAFFARLRGCLPSAERLRIIGALRDERVEAFQVVLRSGRYEVGWFLCSTDRAREESVGPLLTLEWLKASAAAGVRTVDLGSSPSLGVREFKLALGAQPALLYTGVRGLHLWGR